MATFLRDLHYSVRRLLKTPLFTSIAVISLAIGIGANTALFTLVNAVILQRPDLEDPDRLVEVYRSVAGFSHATFSYPDYVDLVAESEDLFAGIAGVRLALVQMDIDGGVETLPGELVTGNYFDLLGLRASAGRLLHADDDVEPGGHPIVLLGFGFWQSRYGGDPSVIGSEIRLNGQPYTIVGVASDQYHGNLKGLSPSVIAPMMMVGALQPSDSNELEARGNQSIFLKARLLPGVPVSQAQATVDRFAERMRTQFTNTWQADNTVTVVPTTDVIMNPMIDRFIRPAAGLLLGVAGLVLLIACANLASFLLAQAADRRKEIAVRLALGAQRRTLIRQLLTESLVLSTVGGLAGVGLSVLVLRALAQADLPLPLPIELDLSPDGTVLLFAVAVTLVAGLAFGLLPALQASNPDVAPTLKDESTGGGVPRRITLRGSLVVTQVALSLVLLMASGLFLRSLQARLNVDPGFGYQPAGILTVQAPPSRYTREEGRLFFSTLVNEASRLPGVMAAGMTYDLHLSPMNNSSMGVQVAGIDPPPGQDYHLIDYAEVDAGFFDAAGIEIARGRGFDQRDTEDGPNVVVVSGAFAERFFPGEDAVGRAFVRNDEDYTVVGVARDAKVRGLGEVPRPFVYLAFEQDYSSVMTVVAATRGNAERTALEMMQIARRIDPEVLVIEQKTMERHLGSMIIGARLGAVVVSAFGLVALLLASIGLYGVVNYAVATRRREMGIRMALGAQAPSVVRMLVLDGMKLVVVGVVLGLGVSLVASRLLSTLLYGIETLDPVAFVLAPSVLGAVALVAAFMPARRAISIEPVAALKAE